jgi:hypothetical protein
MGIKIEIITPTTAISSAPGGSVAITVLKGAIAPLVVNQSSKAVEVISGLRVENFVIRPDVPPNPHEGMVWLEYTP